MKTFYFWAVFFVFFTTSLSAQIRKLAPADFMTEMKAQSEAVQLVDLREEGEFARGHIKRAVQLDYDAEGFEEQVLARFSKTSPIFIYCFTGAKSNNAALFLKDLGYQNIVVLADGFANWTAKSQPYVASPQAIEPVVAYTHQDFNRMIATNKVVLVDFYASWCGPCKKLAPILTKIESDTQNVKFVKFDADRNEVIVNQLGVSEIPTLLLYKNGRLVWKTTGLPTDKQLRDVLGRFVL